MAPITIIVVDDHPVVRSGLAALLADSPSIHLVAEGASGADLRELVALHQPDVALVDLNMPEGLEAEAGKSEPFRLIPALNWLRTFHPRTRVLIITQYDKPTLIQAALAAGAAGYLLKDEALGVQLIEAIHLARSGHTYLSHKVRAHLRQAPEPDLPAPLTERELDVLRQLVARPELSYAELGLELGIALDTVKNHMRRIFAKLGVDNRRAAMLKALQLNLASVALHDLQAESEVVALEEDGLQGG